MKTLKYFLLTLLTALSINSFACTTKDAWTGVDKNKHLVAGVVIGSAGTLVFKDAKTAFIVGSGIGLLKEVIHDKKGGGTCSFQDFAVTALGAAAGAYGTAWVITPRFVGYSMRF